MQIQRVWVSDGDELQVVESRYSSGFRTRWIVGPFMTGVTAWRGRGTRVTYYYRGADQMFEFDPQEVDCGPIEAYCAGIMPAYVFADWLEEQRVDFPVHGLAILRATVATESPS